MTICFILVFIRYIYIKIHTIVYKITTLSMIRRRGGEINICLKFSYKQVTKCDLINRINYL